MDARSDCMIYATQSHNSVEFNHYVSVSMSTRVAQSNSSVDSHMLVELIIILDYYFMAPNLVRARSAYKDIRIRSFHYTHARTHSFTLIHTHSHTHTHNTPTHTHTHTHHTPTHSHTHTRTRTRTHTHTHTHTHREIENYIFQGL